MMRKNTEKKNEMLKLQRKLIKYYYVVGLGFAEQMVVKVMFQSTSIFYVSSLQTIV